MRSDLLMVGLLSVAWCVMHSGLISRTVDAWLLKRLGAKYAFVRLGYVVSSTAGFAVVLWYAGRLEAATLFRWEGTWAVARWTGLAAGLAVFFLGTRVYNNYYFLGFRQIRKYFRGVDPPRPVFRVSGILRYIRHPYYTATILLLVFMSDVTDVNAVWRSVFLVYTVVGTLLEERKLAAEFGDRYLRYKREVPMYLPWKWLKGKLR